MIKSILFLIGGAVLGLVVFVCLRASDKQIVDSFVTRTVTRVKCFVTGLFESKPNPAV